MVRQVAEELAGKAAVVQVDTEAAPGVSGRYAIRGIPALLLMRGNQVLDRKSGALPKEAVLSWVKSHLP